LEGKGKVSKYELESYYTIDLKRGGKKGIQQKPSERKSIPTFHPEKSTWVRWIWIPIRILSAFLTYGSVQMLL